MDFSDSILASAVADFNAGHFKSINATARAYGVARSTLQSRINGIEPRRVVHQVDQRLTPEQEDYLCSWIIDEDARGHPPSPVVVRDMAFRIASANSDPRPIGKNWVSAFKKRNPRVHSVIGKKIDVKRAHAATMESINAFFERYTASQAHYNILPENTWNMDETGLALGVCDNSMVLTSCEKRRAFKATPENREWVSILEAISPLGATLIPLVIFKGQGLQTSWFLPNSLPDWLYTTSKNGWTSNKIGLWWLKQIFLPRTKPAEGI